MRRPAATLLALAAVVSLGTSGCAAGTPESNCRQFLDLFGDVREGRVRDGRELGRRLLDDIGQFPVGTPVRASYDRLVDQIQAGDEQKVAEEMAALAEKCQEVLARSQTAAVAGAGAGGSRS